MKKILFLAVSLVSYANILHGTDVKGNILYMAEYDNKVIVDIVNKENETNTTLVYSINRGRLDLEKIGKLSKKYFLQDGEKLIPALSHLKNNNADTKNQKIKYQNEIKSIQNIFFPNGEVKAISASDRYLLVLLFSNLENGFFNASMIVLYDKTRKISYIVTGINKDRYGSVLLVDDYVLFSVSGDLSSRIYIKKIDELIK